MPATGPTAFIDRAAAALRLGGLVAFPTETVYGLGADALNPLAVAAVFALKGRPPPIHLCRQPQRALPVIDEPGS